MSRTSQTESSGEKSVRIRRGPVDSLSLYEITDHELDTLERGGPSSLFLNFGIALLSISISFLIALFTTQTTSDRTFIVFVIITAIGLISGIVLMFLWYFTRKSIASLIQEIKSRIPADEVGPTEQDEDT